MPHKDKFFSSLTAIKKEDWDRIDWSGYKTRHAIIYGLPLPYSPRIDDPNYYEPQCPTQESS